MCLQWPLELAVWQSRSELVMGWVNPWVGLGQFFFILVGWVGWRLDCVIFLTSWNTPLSVNEYCSWIITFIDSLHVECLSVLSVTCNSYCIKFSVYNRCRWWAGLGRVKTFVGWVWSRNFGLVGLGFEKVYPWPTLVPLVSGLAANCSTLRFQQLRRSCLRNCCTSGWQRAFECQQNTWKFSVKVRPPE